MSRSMRTLLILELLVGLAFPAAAFVAGVIAIPFALMLVEALPSDLATARSPAEVIARPALILYGVGAGALGLYGVGVLARAVLGGVPARVTWTRLRVLLALGLSALAVPFALLGPGRLLVWVLGLVLPVAVVGHLVQLYRGAAR